MFTKLGDRHLFQFQRRMIRDYCHLMRLPNVFTAMADVAMGFCIVHAATERTDIGTLALLVAASSLLYLSGMVLNDVFDIEIDRIERPERPIPSGRVPLETARRLGWTMLSLGVLLGIGTGVALGIWRTGAMAVWLAVAIVLYDAWLKRTPLGPLGMGFCRALNVLLGMSAAGVSLGTEHWLVAGGIGVYIAGVTWFARREAGDSSRLHLTLAAMVMMLGVSMFGWFPSWSRQLAPLLQQEPWRWPVAMALFAAIIAFRCGWAIVEPTPARVRVAVTQGILSLIVIDAAVCYAVRGAPCAVMILLLLAPAVFLGRWIAST